VFIAPAIQAALDPQVVIWLAQRVAFAEEVEVPLKAVIPAGAHHRPAFRKQQAAHIAELRFLVGVVVYGVVSRPAASRLNAIDRHDQPDLAAIASRRQRPDCDELQVVELGDATFFVFRIDVLLRLDRSCHFERCSGRPVTTRGNARRHSRSAPAVFINDACHAFGNYRPP
jgi:hypothetical protein